MQISIAIQLRALEDEVYQSHERTVLSCYNIARTLIYQHCFIGVVRDQHRLNLSRVAPSGALREGRSDRFDLSKLFSWLFLQLFLARPYRVAKDLYKTLHNSLPVNLCLRRMNSRRMDSLHSERCIDQSALYCNQLAHHRQLGG